jgi:hypothetical protein
MTAVDDVRSSDHGGREVFLVAQREPYLKTATTKPSALTIGNLFLRGTIRPHLASPHTVDLPGKSRFLRGTIRPHLASPHTVDIPGKSRFLGRSISARLLLPHPVSLPRSGHVLVSPICSRLLLADPVSLPSSSRSFLAQVGSDPCWRTLALCCDASRCSSLWADRNSACRRRSCSKSALLSLSKTRALSSPILAASRRSRALGVSIAFALLLRRRLSSTATSLSFCVAAPTILSNVWRVSRSSDDTRSTGGWIHRCSCSCNRRNSYSAFSQHGGGTLSLDNGHRLQRLGNVAPFVAAPNLSSPLSSRILCSGRGRVNALVLATRLLQLLTGSLPSAHGVLQHAQK